MLKDLGPCFGMNGHSRRDQDAILRLSKSTTQDLSVFIGFRSLRSVKIDVLDENISFVRNFIEMVFIMFLFWSEDHSRTFW